MTAKIFVVEDQALVARDIQTRLVGMGYEVLGTASRASDAVTQVLSLRPDLVLMDINLKGEMDGIEAATQIAAEADIPIIYCTAYSNEATLARAKITAPYGYVLKPFDNRELEINIQISLHKHQLEQTIKQGRERLAATLSSVSEAIISANQQGEILFANEAACRLLARPFTDLVGLDLRGAIRLGALEMEEAALDLTALPLDAALNELAPKRQRLMLSEDEIVPVEVELSWFDSEFEPLVILTLREITRQLEQEDAILRGAYFDALTLLPNRALFLDRLETRIAQGGPPRSHTILIAYLRLSDLSEVRQGFGPSAGDSVLTELADRWQPLINKDETLAHLGGGDFALLMSAHRDEAQMLALIESFLDEASEDFELGATHFVNLRARAGLVVNSGADITAEHLLRDAESALGRTSESQSWVLFDSEMQATASNELALRNSVYKAIQTQIIEPFLQPIVRLSDRRVVGFEALARWLVDGHEINSPGAFIPAAERSGLMGPLGDLILHHVCSMYEQYAWLYDRGLGIAVNIAASQFDHQLVTKLNGLLEEYPAIEGLLALEITEGTAMSGSGSSLSLIRELRTLGFKVSVDDFGTGYSSLSYLKRFPLDTLKIDQSFVAELQPETDGYVVVKAIIDLAKALGLKTVAEGVETEDQMRLLSDLGCDFGQGYYFQAATPVRDIDACFKNGLPLGRAFTD